MAFPTSPQDQQEAQVNGIIYVWSATKGAWRRKVGQTSIVGNIDQTGDFIANSGTRSTSTTTGAIRVTRGGGIGVTGNVFADAFYSNNYKFANGTPINYNSNFATSLNGGQRGQLVYQIGPSNTGFLQGGDLGTILASTGPTNAPVWVTLQGLAALTGAPYINQIVYPDGSTTTSTQGNEQIYCIGMGFQQGITVTVDSLPVTSVQYISTSNIGFVTSPHSVGTFQIKATNPNRQFGTFDGLEYADPGFPRFTQPAGYLNFVQENLTLNQYITVMGGYHPYTFSIVSGGLPPGMTINSSSGLISGYAPDVDYPTSYNFTVQVVDDEGQTITRNFYILVTLPYVSPNTMTLSSVGSDFIRDSSTVANANVATRQITLSSVGSDFIRDSSTVANANVATRQITLSSVGSDFIRDSSTVANTHVASRIITLSSSGSDFIRDSSTIANVEISSRQLTLSGRYHSR